MAEQRADFSELRAALEAAANEALRATAEHALGEALRRVPEDEGTLADSGHIEPEEGVKRTANGAFVEIVFGTPYAAAQHEGWAIMHSGGTEWRWEAHHYTKPGRGPKYLEGPIKENATRYEEIIGKRVQVELQRRAAG